jgi:1-acyl-sn-glycerol-3-phosphate acyltransferase
MADRLSLYWRVCATGLCFSGFGAGGLVLPLLVFPLLRLVVRQRRRRMLLARALIHRAFRVFVGLMCALRVISVEVRGAEKLRRRGLLILANHPTLIDVVLLMALVEGADCIVKGALVHNPFTRGPVRAAGFACNDCGAALVEDCIASVRGGSNLIVFPEGTRTPKDGSLRLQRGAAHIAVRGGFDVTPVRIAVAPRTLGKGDKWYRVPEQRARFVIDVEDDIRVSRFASRGNEALAARRLNDHLANLFSSERSRAGS